MKIGINALFRFKPTGVANYICNLVNHLSKVDRQNEYVIFTNKENIHYFSIEADNFEMVYCCLNSARPSYRRLWEQFVLPKLVPKSPAFQLSV